MVFRETAGQGKSTGNERNPILYPSKDAKCDARSSSGIALLMTSVVMWNTCPDEIG